MDKSLSKEEDLSMARRSCIGPLRTIMNGSIKAINETDPKWWSDKLEISMQFLMEVLPQPDKLYPSLVHLTKLITSSNQSMNFSA
jgi:hypothetical protein